MNAAPASSAAFSALIWWVVPAVALIGALIYVVWVSKFQDKFNNETNRSVSKFQVFQESFREGSAVITPVQQHGDPSDQTGETIVIRPDSEPFTPPDYSQLTEPIISAENSEDEGRHIGQRPEQGHRP